MNALALNRIGSPALALRFPRRYKGGDKRSFSCKTSGACRLRTWLPRQAGAGWEIKPARPWSPNSVVFAWDAGLVRGVRPHFNSVRFEEGPDGFRALLHHGHAGAGVGLGLLIHEWLTEELADDIRWHAAGEDWSTAGFRMPI